MNESGFIALTIINLIRSSSILWIGIKGKNISNIISSIFCFFGLQFIIPIVIGKSYYLPTFFLGLLFVLVSGYLNKGLTIKPAIWLKDKNLYASFPKDPIIFAVILLLLVGGYGSGSYFIPIYYGRWVVNQPYCPDSDLMALAQKSDDEKTLWEIINHKNCSSKILEVICERDASGFINSALAYSKKLPVDCIRKLAKSENKMILSAIAGNFNTPPEIIMEIVKQNQNDDFPSNEIKKSVAGNPQTPQHILADLLNCEDKSVLRNIAANPSASENMLAQLYHDSDACVKCEVINAIKSMGKSKKERMINRITMGNLFPDPTENFQFQKLSKACREQDSWNLYKTKMDIYGEK